MGPSGERTKGELFPAAQLNLEVQLLSDSFLEGKHAKIAICPTAPAT